MKKLCRRILMLTAMLVLVAGMNAFAAQRQYSGMRLSFPYGGAAWSQQFYLSSSWTTISINVSLTSNASASYVNNHLTYVFQNVSTNEYFNLSGKSTNYKSYTMTATVPRGTYCLGVYYSGAYTLTGYISIYGTGGIKIPDSIEVEVNQAVTVTVVEENTQNSIYIKDASTSDSSVAMVTKINNNVTPPTVTVTGFKKGNCTITVTASDGSSDGMSVKVVKEGAAPTLQYTDLDLSGGEVVYNEVLNDDDYDVSWKTSKKAVATVNKYGKITAKGHGSCTVSAVLKRNGVEVYELPCSVSVTRSYPSFQAKITSVKPAKKKLVVQVKNYSGVKMIVYSSGAKLYKITDDGDSYCIRNMKLKSGKSVTVKNNKSVKITYVIKGSKISEDKEDLVVRLKFKVDGKVYYMRAFGNKNYYSTYILKKNIATNNWKSSYTE